MRVDGACHCGCITFEAEIDPARVSICHCADCQTLSGSAFRVSAAAEEARFRLLSGTPKIYVKTGESGRKREQAFCADCGTQIYATSVGGENRTLGIRAGTLRQRRELVPRRQWWCQSRLPWLPDLPGESFDRQ